MRVVVHGAAHLGAVGHPDHDGATGEGSEVDADRELVGAGHAGTSPVVSPPFGRLAVDVTDNNALVANPDRLR